MSNHRPTLLCIALFLGLAAPAGAWELHPLFEKVRQMVTPKPLLMNPESVWQPSAYWSISLTGGLRQAGIWETYTFPDTDEGLPQTLTARLQGNVDRTVGLDLGYGRLSGGMSWKIGPKGKKNATYSFDYITTGYALQLQYFRLRQPMEYEVTYGAPLQERSFTSVAEDPSRMTAFIADAFYAFNRLNFAYSAVYKGNVVQRRSTGSFMFATKFITGSVEDNPSASLPGWTGGDIRQSTTQVSFGGGVSYNWVPWHRDPTDNKGNGLRNLTVNLTAIPLVTLYNEFSSSTTFPTADGEQQNWKERMNGGLMFNYVARLGVCYTHGLFFANLSAAYDRFSFSGQSALPGVSQNVDTKGRFNRWTVTFRAAMRF